MSGLTGNGDRRSIVRERQESSAATGPETPEAMREVLRTNDVVLLSFVEALLTDADIGFRVLDAHTASVEGSILAIPRRVVVDDADAPAAQALIDGARDGVPQ
jgi:hypothetical protein